MRAFWWYEEGAIAGMARPGFNHVHWFDLAFDEAIAMSCVGQHSSGAIELESFREHLKTYAPKVYKFYHLDAVSGPKALEGLHDEAGILEVMNKLVKKTRFLEKATIADGHVHVTLSEARLREEIAFMKSHDIDRVVSLTERHHGKDILEEHFDLHHFSIEDIGAPTVEQVHELAEVVAAAKRDREKLAVHCLAGIGRTSTMILAAHLALGETFESLKARIARCNPSYVLTGAQGEFLDRFARR